MSEKTNLEFTILNSLTKQLGRTDSIEVGSPSKGRIKVYGNASDPEEWKQRIENAILVLSHAKLQMITAKD